MAKYKRADFVSALDRIRDLPAERRRKIEAGAVRILERMHLAEIPLKSDRPVKSRLKVEKSSIPE